MKSINLQFIKRLVVYLIGVYFTAVAIAISKMTPLGISPNSSLPNEISLILDANLGLVTAIVCFYTVDTPRKGFQSYKFHTGTALNNLRIFC